MTESGLEMRSNPPQNSSTSLPYSPRHSQLQRVGKNKRNSTRIYA